MRQSAALSLTTKREKRTKHDSLCNVSSRRCKCHELVADPKNRIAVESTLLEERRAHECVSVFVAALLPKLSASRFTTPSIEALLEFLSRLHRQSPAAATHSANWSRKSLEPIDLLRERPKTAPQPNAQSSQSDRYYDSEIEILENLLKPDTVQ